jgi:hypothetical protein
LFHVPAQRRVIAPRGELGRADPSELAARRDEEQPYPLIERLACDCSAAATSVRSIAPNCWSSTAVINLPRSGKWR